MNEKFLPKVKEALRELWYGPIVPQVPSEQKPVSTSEALRNTMDQLGRTTVLSSMGVDLSGDSDKIFKDPAPIRRPLRILDYLDPRHPRIR